MKNLIPQQDYTTIAVTVGNPSKFAVIGQEVSASKSFIAKSNSSFQNLVFRFPASFSSGLPPVRVECRITSVQGGDLVNGVVVREIVRGSWTSAGYREGFGEEYGISPDRWFKVWRRLLSISGEESSLEVYWVMYDFSEGMMDLFLSRPVSDEYLVDFRFGVSSESVESVSWTDWFPRFSFFINTVPGRPSNLRMVSRV